MSNRRPSITLSIKAREKAQLEQLALKFGQTWGDRPNISRLIKAIAKGKLRLAASHDWSRELIDALNRARTLLIDSGQVERAVAIANLLLEHSELTLPLRGELEQFVAQPVAPWRLEVERYIRSQQPFQLAYQDAAGQVWRFTIRYAEIVHHEERQYLDCWCDETAGNQDLPELCHNWCLRLDRIAEDAAISSVAGRWRQSGLDHIPAELLFMGPLAFAYRTKLNADIVNEWHPNRPQVRRVIRQITSGFWFFREICRYGEDCEIISPASVRMRMKQKVQALTGLYQREP